MTRFLLWLWERTELLRFRIDLWASRARIRQAQAWYDAETRPAVRAIIFRVLAARRRHYATMKRTLAIMNGEFDPTPTATETADNPPEV